MAGAKAVPGLFTADQAARLAAWAGRYPYPAMGLLGALRDVQAWLRHVPPEAEALVAGLLSVPLRRVHEVVTFYPYFTLEPCGRYRIGVCRNLSCQLAGGRRVLEALGERLGVEEGETTPDGLFSFEAVECLGACDHAPAVSVNDELAGAGSPELVARLVEAGRRGGLPPAADPGRSAFYAGAAEGARRLLTAHFDDPLLHTLAAYRARGGYRAWEKARGMAPPAIVEEVNRSNLRGLGGAGFPAGAKWETVPPKSRRAEPHYVVANADESEPGCFKDRVLMERCPHGLIEGLLIAGRAVEADGLFVFIRGEYSSAERILSAAVEEAREAGILGGLDVLVMRGADAYISGADTALLETMEGKKAWPRQPPPFPTASGVMGHPTVVNNVETLMMVPKVVELGSKAFAELGSGRSGGTVVFSVSGHVERPGVYEFRMGTPLKAVLEAAGGVRGGRKLKAVIPGGVSTPVMTAAEAMEVRMDFDGPRAAGSFLGAGGLIALDETADMVEVLEVIERFLARESCGQCTPCREGSEWISRLLKRHLAGGGLPGEVDELVRIGENVTGRTICALGDTVGMVAKAMASKFRPDFDRRMGPAGGRALGAASPGGHGGPGPAEAARRG